MSLFVFCIFFFLIIFVRDWVEGEEKEDNEVSVELILSSEYSIEMPLKEKNIYFKVVSSLGSKTTLFIFSCPKKPNRRTEKSKQLRIHRITIIPRIIIKNIPKKQQETLKVTPNISNLKGHFPCFPYIFLSLYSSFSFFSFFLQSPSRRREGARQGR